MEHYYKLYAQDLPEHPGMEAVLPSFGVHAELDEEPTEEELSWAISALSKGKVLGEEGIPAEIFQENKDVLLPQLHAMLATTQNTIQNAGRQHRYPVQKYGRQR